MPYQQLSDTEFSIKYKALILYLVMHRNRPSLHVSNPWANLAADPFLKGFFVLNSEGKSFLHVAAAEGNLELISFLVENHHEINRKDIHHKTPLYDACSQLKLGAVNTLLGYGADPNLGNSDVLTTVTQNGKDISYRGEIIPLVAAIESKAIVTVTEFVSTATTHENLSLLTEKLATKRTQATIVKNLLVKDADILLQTGIDDYSALHRAILHRELLVINEIADVGGAEIFEQHNRDGEVALHLVARFLEKDEKEDPKVQAEMEIEAKIADMLIEHAVDKLPHLLALPELKFGNTPIHSAVICSNPKILKKFLIKGYKLNTIKNLSRQNFKGNTPIHEAVNEAWRGPKVLALLLSVAMPDDLSVVNHASETAEQMAVRMLQEANSVKALLEKVEKANTDLEQFVDGSNEVIQSDEIDVPDEIGQLLETVRDLRDSDPLDDKLSDLDEEGSALSLELDNFIIELEKYDIKGFRDQADKQLEKYERDAHWSVEDAKQLVAKATTLNLQGIHIPEAQYANQASLSKNDADNLAASVRVQLEKYDQGERMLDFSLDLADELGPKAQGLISSIKNLEFFQKSYIDSLTDVKQENFLAWKAIQLQLPSSFSNLKIVDTHLLFPPNPSELIYNHANAWYDDGLVKYNSGDYLGATSSLGKSIKLFEQSYAGHLAYAHAHYALAHAYLALNNNPNVNVEFAEDNNKKAQINLKEAIKIYANLEDFKNLEYAYQTLAKNYIKDEFSIASYEEYNRDELLFTSDSQKELQGHLALAGLYKELRDQNFQSSAFSLSDLRIRESYHYHQAYKLTQGKLDNSARVVLQREIGIANNANLGTYNIQQCITVVAFDPQSKKVVLSHFDKASGPVSFIEQLAKQFPGRSPIHLYISGGRDRWAEAATIIPSKISDNNIDLVLKQIHRKNIEDATNGKPENGRFKIKSCDVGDKPSPQGIVFDVQSQRLIHATPNFADNSLESRSVCFLLQKVNEDYVRPLNPVDFRKSEAERTISFSAEEQNRIRTQLDEQTIYYAHNPQSKTWEHDQLFYPLITINNEISKVTRPDFTKGLLTEYRTRYLTPIRDSEYIYRELERSNIPDLEDGLSNLQMIDPSNFLDDEAMNQMLPCLDNRRRRDVGLCTLDSEHLLERLGDLSESKQAEILDHVATRKVGGTKQEQINTLVRNYKLSRHLQTVNAFSSRTMESLFAADAIAGMVNGDKTATALWVDFKLLDRISTSGSRTANVALNLYSTYENFNNLRNHTNDPAAWLRFASSGSQAVVDLGSFSVKGLEGISESFAALEISAPFEMVGGAIVTVLIVTDRFYEAGKALKDEEDLLRKDFSFEIKFTEFWRAFFGSSSAFQGKINDIYEYKNLLPQLEDFFKKYPEFKWYVSSAIQQIDTKKICVSRGLTGKGCRQYKYTPIFAEIKNNFVNFSAKQTGFKLNNEIQDAFPNSEFACLPTGDDISVTNAGTYRCDGAFALRNPNSTGTGVFLDLGDGVDQAIGFKNLSHNFLVRDGEKAYVGGKKADLFMLAGTQIVTAIKQGEIGGLHGGEDIDTLDLRMFKPETDYIELDLSTGQMKYGSSILHITGVEQIIGGAIPLGVTVACDTKVLDTAAQGIAKSPDSIFIPSNTNCDYDLEIHLRPNMSVTNGAEKGHIIYPVSLGHGNVLVNLPVRDTNAIGANIKHQFEFSAMLSDVTAISLSTPNEGSLFNLSLQFGKSLANQSVESFIFVLRAQEFNTTFLRFSDQGKLKIGNKNVYYVHSDLNQPPSEIIRYYAPLIKQLNLVGLFITGENEHTLIGHNKHEVMQNNPNAFRTHLYGNGGKDRFELKSGMSPLILSRLPIPQVDIYHLPGDVDTKILDFRLLMHQVQVEMNQTAQLFLVTPNAQNHLGEDLLLILGIFSSSHPQQMMPIATVNLPNAFHPSQYHWFKKLHILLGIAPLRIEGRHKHLFLKPAPLILNEKQEIAEVSIRNVETNTTVVIPKAYKEGVFFQHNKTNLIWTNTLTNTNSINHTRPFTLIIVKFFQEPKMETLLLQFTDKTLSLTNKSTEFNATADFKETKNAHLVALDKEFSAILNSNSSISKVRQIHKHYLSNNINATSIKDHSDNYSNEEINTLNSFVRQRRSVVEDFDFAATSGASRLPSWKHFPKMIAENILHTTAKIFTTMQSSIWNVSAYWSDINFSVNSDSLNQASILGNKTSIDHPTTIQEYAVNTQDVLLKKCVALKLADIDQKIIDGVSCSIPNAKINFFQNIFFEQLEDSFSNCQPIEWYGRPSVLCKGKKTAAIVTPQLPQRIFDPVDSWLMLGQLTIAMVNNFFSKPVADTRYQLVEEFSMKISLLLEIKLTAAKLRLKSLQKQKGVSIKDLNWISLQLEDRQEEFEQFRKLNRITNNEVTEFTENFFALQEMLDEIEEMPTYPFSNFPQKDNDVFARAANGNYSSSFFGGLTQPSGFVDDAANQINTVKKLISTSV